MKRLAFIALYTPLAFILLSPSLMFFSRAVERAQLFRPVVEIIAELMMWAAMFSVPSSAILCFWSAKRVTTDPTLARITLLTIGGVLVMLTLFGLLSGNFVY